MLDFPEQEQENKESQRRMALAFALSFLVILIFYMLVPRTRAPVGERPLLVPSQESYLQSQAGTAVEEPTLPAPEAPIKDINYETEKYILTLYNATGSVKSIVLKDYRLLSEDAYLPLAEALQNKPAILEVELYNQMGQPLPIGAAYQCTHTDSGLSFKASIPNIGWIEKEYIFHNSKHSIELRITLQNESHQLHKLNYRLTGGTGIVQENALDQRFLEVMAAEEKEGQILRFTSRSIRLKNGSASFSQAVQWVSLKNRYFSLLLKPLTSNQGFFVQRFQEDKKAQLQSGLQGRFDLSPASQQTQRFILYAGPSSYPELATYNMGFEKALTAGFLGPIAQLLMQVLGGFYKAIHNWGWSIIMLTFCIALLLFPLTRKSLKSMKEMQLLQPEMEKLRAQYKGSPQKLNKEILELYREHKVNPLGGCFPLFLQMPVFISLYRVLMRAVELRGANFLWIKDLSSPDATKLPFLPMAINILPLIMILAMVLQQRFSSGGKQMQNPQQRQMALMMPIIFGVIFYSLPSGLVLYWLTNTTIMIIVQTAFLSKVGLTK